MADKEIPERRMPPHLPERPREVRHNRLFPSSEVEVGPSMMGPQSMPRVLQEEIRTTYGPEIPPRDAFSTAAILAERNKSLNAPLTAESLPIQALRTSEPPIPAATVATATGMASSSTTISAIPNQAGQADGVAAASTVAALGPTLVDVSSFETAADQVVARPPRKFLKAHSPEQPRRSRRLALRLRRHRAVPRER